MKSNRDPILLYDDQCGFCSYWVDFVIQRQKRGGVDLLCLALESEQARDLLHGHDLDPHEIDSVVYITDGRAFIYSSAVVRILRDCRFPWCWLSVLWCVPKGLRDWGYRWVALRRQRSSRCVLH